MADHNTGTNQPQLDLSDVDHRLGELVGGGQLLEPCSASDIRRWVMAMDYPNPIHWDDEFAKQSEFGGIIAPQSIAVALDYGHGVQPACVGRIPGSHLIFGGEEWWFYGVPVRPGDQLFQERRFYDYKVVETKFAGPTMFSRGDTIHTNQHGALVAKERSTAIRYLATEAEKRGMYENQLGAVRRWTNEELLHIERVRHDWLMSNRLGVSPHFEEVKIGDKLPRRVLGPHSIATFTTEYRAFVFNIWGTFGWVAPPGVKEPWINQDFGLGRRLWVRRGRRQDRSAQARWALCRPLARPHRCGQGQRDRHGARLWLRRNDGRVGDRLSGVLGRT